MTDWFWSLWQSVKYPARSTNPACIFVPDPTLEYCAQYRDFFDIPSTRVGTTRVAFISDTHGRHSALRVPPCDVLCHCGDIMFMGGRFSRSYCEDQYAAFDQWMATQPCTHKLVIAGNHDQHLQDIGVVSAAALFPHCTYLCNQQFTVAGLRFLASPYSRGNSPNSAFQASLDAAAFDASVRAAAEAGGIDVLLTHSSCSSDTIASLSVKVHAWGHIHNRYGIRLLERQDHVSWLDICACSVDSNYAHTHGVVVVDIPQSPTSTSS